MKVKDALKVSLFFLFLIGFGISVFADEAEDCIYQNDKIRIVVGYHEDGSLNKVSTSIVSESVDLEGYSLDYTFIASQVNEKYQQGEKFFCPLYANGYHDDEKKILWFQLSDETDIGAYMVINRAKKPTPSSTPGQDPGSSEPGGSTPGSPSSGGQPQQHFHLGDDPKIRDLCSSSGFLTILGMVLNIITILKIAVPLILIGMLTIQIYPLINNPAEVKQVIEKSKKKIIAAVLIFFVPTIMNVILSALGDSTSVSTCYEHARDEAYIKERENAEKNYFSGTTE